MQNKTLVLTILALIAVGSISAYFEFKKSVESNLGASVFQVRQGGTGTTTFPVGECLKGNGTGALTTGECGGGSQTPWTTAIDANNNTLSNVGTINLNATSSYKINNVNMLSTGAGGANNIAIGPNALSTTTANGSIGIGNAALANNNAAFNIGIGYTSIPANVSGIENVSIGSYSLQQNEGSDNTVLGYKAGQLLRTGSYNIIIGNYANPPLTSSSNMITIGNLIYGTGLPSLTSSTSTPVTGNVGIGTATPFSKLTVNGDITFSTSTQGLVLTSPSGYNYRVQVDDSGFLTTYGSSTAPITLAGAKNNNLMTADQIQSMIKLYINSMSIWDKFLLFIHSLF